MTMHYSDADKWQDKIKACDFKREVYKEVARLISDIIDKYNLGADKNGVDDLSESYCKLDSFYKFAFEYFIECRLQEKFSAGEINAEIKNMFAEWEKVNG